MSQAVLARTSQRNHINPGDPVNGRRGHRVQLFMSVITAALAGVGVAASVMCPVAVALSRAAWMRGMRQGYYKARRHYDQDVSETAAAILARATATRRGPQLRPFPGNRA